MGTEGKTASLLANRPSLILYVTVGVVLIIVASVFAPRMFAGDGSDAAEPDGPRLDPANAEFYVADRGMSTGDLAQLKDGSYSLPGTGGEVRLVEDSVETSVDIDGNGSGDVVAVLEWSGVGPAPYDSWRSIHAWLNLEGSVVPYEHPLAWEWNCAAPDQGVDEVFPSAITVSAHGGIGSWRQTSNTCGDDVPAFVSRTGFAVAIVNGYPVQTSPNGYRTATEQCGRSKEQYDGQDFIEVRDAAELLAFPAHGAPRIQTGTDTIETVVVWKPDTTSDRIDSWNGYIPVSIVVQYDIAHCGWAPPDTL